MLALDCPGLVFDKVLDFADSDETPLLFLVRDKPGYKTARQLADLLYSKECRTLAQRLFDFPKLADTVARMQAKVPVAEEQTKLLSSFDLITALQDAVKRGNWQEVQRQAANLDTLRRKAEEVASAGITPHVCQDF